MLLKNTWFDKDDTNGAHGHHDSDEDNRVWLPNGAMGRVTGWAKEGDAGVYVRFVGEPAPLLVTPAKWTVHDHAAPVATAPVVIEVDSDGDEVRANSDSEAEDAKAAVYQEPARPRIAERAQIPLAIAYALSVHKSMGQTLTGAVTTDLGSVFEAGQAYVALSRVRTLGQLSLRSLNPNALRAHPKAVAFYAALPSNSIPNTAVAVPTVAPAHVHAHGYTCCTCHKALSIGHEVGNHMRRFGLGAMGLAGQIRNELVAAMKAGDYTCEACLHNE
jgi:hypothetical protein